MLFNSLRFAVFFPFVCLAFFVMPRRVRPAWLLVTSYFFYMNWNAAYAMLIALSTITTFLAGIGVEKYEKYRKFILGGCIVINFAILFYFKYFVFFFNTVNSILAPIGISFETSYSVILPVGISFYTFQAVGYIIDVYRGEVQAEKNIIKYGLFVSFFPQLVAGPIERSKNLLNQIRNIGSENKNTWNWKRVKHGLLYMLYGLFLKMVMADQLAMLVDYGYDNLAVLGSVELIIVAVAFSMQIYCDFYSYSIIAIGAAQVLGFTLMENFEAPYFAKSIKEFWRRWHISLSTWFKDYLYIPLGGNRQGNVKKIRNILIVFLLSGLWHGANWTFVIWGGIHGMYQVVGELLMPIRKILKGWLDLKDNSMLYRGGQMLVTFALTTFAWIFFRAENLSQAGLVIEKIFLQWNPWVFFDGSLQSHRYVVGVTWGVLVIGSCILFFFDMLLYKRNIRFDEFVCAQGYFLQNVVVVILLVMILIFGIYGYGYDTQAFVYFQF